VSAVTVSSVEESVHSESCKFSSVPSRHPSNPFPTHGCHCGPEYERPFPMSATAPAVLFTTQRFYEWQQRVRKSEMIPTSRPREMIQPEKLWLSRRRAARKAVARSSPRPLPRPSIDDALLFQVRVCGDSLAPKCVRPSCDGELLQRSGRRERARLMCERNPSGPHTEQWLMSQADCESNCLADPSCTAYEWATVGTDSFGYSRCELQSGNVDSIRPSVNHICQVKSSSSKRLFDTHNRLITENSRCSKRHPYPTPA